MPRQKTRTCEIGQRNDINFNREKRGIRRKGKGTQRDRVVGFLPCGVRGGVKQRPTEELNNLVNPFYKGANVVG